MDNYDLSNLPLLGHCEDAGGRHPWLTDEENRQATFSRRSETLPHLSKLNDNRFLRAVMNRFPNKKRQLILVFHCPRVSSIL